MDIQQTNTSYGSTVSSSAQVGAGTSAISADFETFLKMLTTQLENQDPLNPVDSSDYAVQLATFSGVEQQVLTNQLLSDLAGGGGLSGLADLAPWVGMEARVASPDITFNATPIDLHFTVPPAARKSELVLSSPIGQELQRIDVTGQTSPYTWVGTGVLTGAYKIEALHTDSKGGTTTSGIETYARVTEVRAGTEGADVVLDDGRVVGSTTITALRTP
ncbi:flagellar hook capping FlgD N-terminal domain-containing protein [Pseudoruegeria sp. SK021]|uniref:flagellar hook capping FlgD N-terminal domain-containing protein n=1 Tax=Pseudoruegeria sp. SK021 TaxID=1933035 RepID=UPI000A23CDC8|nr:flagellar hook capping FlgD N-terminal domain-containing protein [Pseudoruegeria sp. SK021]OSP54736.1 hypothetical protein BV911_11270 [Pseudoruegeria sp. SK021]